MSAAPRGDSSDLLFIHKLFTGHSFAWTGKVFSFFDRRKQPGKQAQKSYWYLIQVCKNWSRNCSGFSKRPVAGWSNIPSPQSESLGNPKLKDVLLGLYHHKLARIKHSEIDFCVSGKSSGKRIIYVVLFEPRAHTRNSFILLFQTTFRLKNASFTTRYCKKCLVWFFFTGFTTWSTWSLSCWHSLTSSLLLEYSYLIWMNSSWGVQEGKTHKQNPSYQSISISNLAGKSETRSWCT